MRSLFGELGCHQGVNGTDQGAWKISATDSGLIRDHDGRIFRFVQPPDGPRGKRKHTKTAKVIQVTHFFGNRSIAIEEDGRTKRCFFSQRPPPRSAASLARLLQRLPVAHLSCSGGQWGNAAENTDCSTAFLAPRC